MNNIKTILLIGRTGNGKSTLANVLLGKRDKEGNFEELFGESAGSVSETKKVQIEEFEYEGIKYRVVDTVGVGDTRMSLDKVLRKLALMGYSVKDGVSQILFVTDGQLAKEAKSTYNLLKKVVFDENISKYTTIIRTNFPFFWNKEESEKEREEMIKRSEGFHTLIEECGDEKIIYVDNPPINLKSAELISFNKKRREDSRKILFNHLKKVCKNDDVYKPVNLVILGSEISKYMIEKERMKEDKKSEKDLVAFTSRENNERGTDQRENPSRVFSFSRTKSFSSSQTEVSEKSEKISGKLVNAIGKGGKSTVKGIKKIAGTVGSSVTSAKNVIINKEITSLMLERIGEIDIRLKGIIEEELKRLENKQKEGEEKSLANWTFDGEINKPLRIEEFRKVNSELNKQEKKTKEEFNKLIVLYLSQGKLDNFLYYLPEFFLENQTEVVEKMRDALKTSQGLSQEEVNSLLGKKLRITQIKEQLDKFVEKQQKNIDKSQTSSSINLTVINSENQSFFVNENFDNSSQKLEAISESLLEISGEEREKEKNIFREEEKFLDEDNSEDNESVSKQSNNSKAKREIATEENYKISDQNNIVSQDDIYEQVSETREAIDSGSNKQSKQIFIDHQTETLEELYEARIEVQNN